MTEYSAIATREDDLWVVSIPGVGTTQATSRDEVRYMARDYIALMNEVPIEDVHVKVIWPVTPRPWDAMVEAALEIIRRDSGYPSVADMDHDMPAWRQQCEEIANAMLMILLGAVDAPLEDDGRRCPRCRPDNTCTLWCLDSMIAENTPGMVQEVFGLRRQCNLLQASLEAIDHDNLLDRYTRLVEDFNTLRGQRCAVFTCDHLEKVHGDMGCEFCSCLYFLRSSTT